MAATARIVKTATGTLLVLAVLLACGYGWLSRRVPRQPRSPQLSETTLSWPSTDLIPTSAWQVVVGTPRTAEAATSGPLANRFRLAGTFFLYGGEGTTNETNRRAILDDVQKNQQSIVREGDTLEEFRVHSVQTDRVTLRAQNVDYELALSFSDKTEAAPEPAAATGETQVVSMEDMPALETSRFGKRVGENRWVFKREELLKFYQEVLDEPERIAKIYLSLKPDYQGEAVEGYRLTDEGESEFFKAVGLQETDTIRKVNSMRMVSQRRAEYFLSEFLKNRVSALVLDIEREGKPEKLIYLIR